MRSQVNSPAKKGSDKTKQKQKQAKPKPKMGNMNGGGTGDDTVTSFYSAGSRTTQPPFSDLSRNFYSNMDLLGNPFFTGTQPSSAASKYDYNRIALNVSDYFVDNLFGAYEYYRVSKIETIFTWCDSDANGYVNGELYTSIDKDSRDAETSNAYINRRNLKRRVFNVNDLSHTITYQPYMVDFLNDEDNNGVQYIQPQDRWWNCEEFRNHRWGCLRYILINNAASGEVADASCFVKHRVWIETKGQKDVITPSVPPAAFEYGKQNLELTKSIDAETREEIWNRIDEKAVSV